MIQNSGHDKHVDIWCLGVLLFELLTGTPPFIGQNRILLMKNIINVNIVWPSPPRLPIDPDAKDLISKILKKRPNERISLENMIKHNFFIKYCPNVKPFFDQRQKFHSKPFVISKDIPNDDTNYDFDSIDNNLDKIEKKIEVKKNLDIRLLFRTSQKKNKRREITPEPSASNIFLEHKKKIDNNYVRQKIVRQNTKTQFRGYNSNNNNQTQEEESIDNNNKVSFEEFNRILKEKEKLEKDIEDYKLREIGYNKKIEELTFALNNINQENILLKMDLEKQKLTLEKKNREINRLLNSRNLNLNLNNQTTYNINTASNNNMDIDLENIRRNNYKKISDERNKGNNRTFISKTPEGLQRKGKKIILTQDSYMKPYTKKKGIFNIKTSTNENWKKKDISNNSQMNELNDINKIKNKRINPNNKDNNIEINFNTQISEKDRYRFFIEQLQRDNDSLKIENSKNKNSQHNNIKSLSKKDIDEY